MYKRQVQKGETLHISYIGYVAQDVKIMGNQPVKVVMSEDTETLDGVVVVGTAKMCIRDRAYRFCGNLPEQDSLIVADEEASFNLGDDPAVILQMCIRDRWMLF